MIRTFILSVARGFAMGTADIVPGVSGGTIALVLGIYERLITSVSAGSSAISSLIRGNAGDARHWLGKVEWSFLIPLLAGILLAVFTLAHLIERLLRDEAVIMAALFVGLVAGSTVIAWKMIRHPQWTHAVIAIGVGAAAFIILGLRSGTTEEAVRQIADPALWAFFTSGALAICAMILPGISGSFILIMLGMFAPVLAAVTDLDLIALMSFIVGAVIGLAIFSQFLDWALKNHHDVVLAALVGLMAGSLRVLWPWPLGVDSTALGMPDSDIGLAVVAAVAGFIIVITLAWSAARLDAAESPQPAVGS